MHHFMLGNYIFRVLLTSVLRAMFKESIKRKFILKILVKHFFNGKLYICQCNKYTIFPYKLVIFGSSNNVVRTLVNIFHIFMFFGYPASEYISYSMAGPLIAWCEI
jgi:hypothetical protein